MARHYAPPIQFQIFFSLAIFYTFYQYFFVLISNEQIYPVSNCKTCKIQFTVIDKFIFPAHSEIYKLGFLLASDLLAQIRQTHFANAAYLRQVEFY